jgi:oligopeptidase B
MSVKTAPSFGLHAAASDPTKPRMIDPATLPTPPEAARHPHSFERHGQVVSDDYAWLRDAGYPNVTDEAVLSYLKEENAYFEAAMAPARPLVDTLFAEMKGRMKEDDSSVPRKDGDWDYWWGFETGAQYRRWLRRPTGSDEPGRIVLDEAKEAEGHTYFRLGALAISPDGKLAAWASDVSGAERFTLRIRDLATGADIETVSEVVNGAVVWSDGSDAVAYTEVNDNWRTFCARLHRLGSDPAGDPTLYEETDDIGFNVHVGRTQDRQWIVVGTNDHETSEIRLVPAADPSATPLLVAPRKAKRQYGVDSAHGKLWVHTNDDHINFRIAVASPETPDEWETVIAGSDQVYIRGLSSFAGHLVIEERVDGLDQIRLRTYDGDEHRIAFPEPSYTAALGTNPEYDSPGFRIGYASMVTPDTVFEYDPATRSLATLKVREVPSGYDASLYATERLIVPARDGASIPVSIVYRKDFPRDGSGPLYLYAYGAYGIAIPPSFSADRLSLLDRGWACAIAHIRGGDDMGYGWYLDGKAGKRWNTFHDFSDAAKGLIAAGFASAGRIAIQGGSAGGELMGVVANTDPDLWGAVVADVPFVDVLNTMLDETLPLTPGEWPEWGNPITDPAAFDLIRSYSPYDQVSAQSYPPMLITGGLNDPRVTYWEPAKWAARLRASKTDANPLLLKINMGAGHGGKSGRYEAITERAEGFAFMIEALG